MICTIGKILRCRCLKWAHMIQFSAYNTSYGRKKGGNQSVNVTTLALGSLPKQRLGKVRIKSAT
jgi:hypothetical protein